MYSHQSKFSLKRYIAVHSKLSLSAILRCQLQLYTVLRSSASKLSGHCYVYVGLCKLHSFYKCVKSKGKTSLYWPGQAVRIPRGWGSQISRPSTHENGKVIGPMHQLPLPPRKYSWYSFLLEAESTPRL